MCKGNIISKKNGYNVIDCVECGFKHVYPYPNDEVLEKIYSEEYYTRDKPNYISEYQKDRDWWNLVYDYRYNIFSDLIKKEHKSILDIGSGPGHFLLEGQKKGWFVHGLEPNIDAYNYSKKDLNLNISKSFYEIGTRFEKKYDVINLGEVLEHLNNPKIFIKDLVENLNKGGLISIIVPNDFNPFQMIVNENCNNKEWWILPPWHLNYFNFDSLKKFLKDIGLEVVLSQSTFPLEMFCFFGENYINNPEHGKLIHKKRMDFEFILKNKNPELIHKFYNSLAELNLGREIFMIAKKI